MKESAKYVAGRQQYQDVWAALKDDPRGAANLRPRSTLMIKIEVTVRRNARTQSGVTQPRINQLLRGHISKFSPDALFKIVILLGRKVRSEVEAA